MQRDMRHFSNGLDGDWNRVTGTTPCPICGGDADCRTHSDEAFACCVQRPSEWRLNNGGWLHRVAVTAEKFTRDLGLHCVDFGKAKAVPSGVLP
jgi:hypothetical protein